MVYSSYDYSAPLRETRQIQDKLSQTKLIALFTRVSKDLLTTDMIGNGTGYAVSFAPPLSFHNANTTRSPPKRFSLGNFEILPQMQASTQSSNSNPVPETQ